MSSGEKKHDYHLVDPSPWPIFTSFACLVLAVGAVYYFHTKALWLMLIGTALLIYGSCMWFRDVIDEAEKQGHHTMVVQITHRYGMTLFIASEVMFFVAWFWAFFNASLFPTEAIGKIWPPADIKTFDPWDIPLINTSVINRMGLPYLGVGEAVAGPTGASISNALKRALGERIQSMPFSTENITKQLLG